MSVATLGAVLRAYSLTLLASLLKKGKSIPDISGVLASSAAVLRAASRCCLFAAFFFVRFVGGSGAIAAPYIGVVFANVFNLSISLRASELVESQPSSPEASFRSSMLPEYIQIFCLALQSMLRKLVNY